MMMRMVPTNGVASRQSPGRPPVLSMPAEHGWEKSAAAVTRGIVISAAAIAAVGMVVAALWAWQGAVDIVADWEVSRPGAILWAIRCGAIAAAALAQVVIFGGVAGQIFPRRRGDQAVVISAAGVFVLAVIAGVVLALLGR